MRQWMWAGLIFLVAAGGFAGTWWGWPELYGRGGTSAVSGGLSARVVRGPLVLTVSDDGEVIAGSQKVIRNELRWPVYIDRLVPDGTMVRGPRGDKPGDTIISFKCEELEEAILEQELRLAEAKNASERAKANLGLDREETEYLVRKAQQEVKEAEEDEKRYSDPGGEGDTKLKEAESDIQLASEELKLAQAKLESMVAANKELAPNSPYSKNEVEAAELNFERRKLALVKAEDHMRMLITYDLARDKRRLRVATEEGRLALVRAKFEAEQRMAKAKQDRDAKDRIFRSTERKYLDLVNDRDTKLTYTADKDGLVVYETGGHRHFRTTDVTIAEGEEVQPRQQLMIIPDMTTLQVEIKVYESMISELEARLNGSRGKAPREGKASEGEPERIAARLKAIRDLPAGEREEAMKKLRAEGQRRRRAAAGAERTATTRPAAIPRPRPAEARKSDRRIEAFIELPGLGGRVVKGYVDTLPPIAEEKSYYMNPGVNIYRVIVKLAERVEGLKPKMKASVTLIANRLPNVLKVPVVAVFKGQDKKTYCWRVRGGRAEKAEVEIGKSNDQEAQILRGLVVGDEVLLVAPVASGEKAAASQPDKTDKSQSGGTAKP